MSMYNDIAWDEKGNTERCEYNPQTVANYARKFPRGHWSFLGPGSEKKWYGTNTDKPDGSWDKIAENMMTNFADSGHLLFRASSAFEREENHVEYLHQCSTGSAVQALSSTHSQSSRSFHSYHSYHPRFAPKFQRVVGARFATRHLVRDLIEVFLLAACNVAILLVHANVNLFLSLKIDHF